MKGLPYIFRNKHLAELTDTGARNGTNIKKRVLAFLLLPMSEKVSVIRWAIFSQMTFAVIYSKLGLHTTEEDIQLLEKEKAEELKRFNQRKAEQKKVGEEKGKIN